MSRFRTAPRLGHMNRLKRIHRTDQPDYSFLPDQDFDWTYSVYGDVHNILPDDMPEPLGKAVVTTTTMDDNLNHRQNSNQKEPCLTPTLMDESQAKNPNTT